MEGRVWVKGEGEGESENADIICIFKMFRDNIIYYY